MLVNKRGRRKKHSNKTDVMLFKIDILCCHTQLIHFSANFIYSCQEWVGHIYSTVGKKVIFGSKQFRSDIIIKSVYPHEIISRDCSIPEINLKGNFARRFFETLISTLAWRHNIVSEPVEDGHSFYIRRFWETLLYISTTSKRWFRLHSQILINMIK